VLGEYVQDQGGPVDHLDLDHAFKPPQLAGAELTVADHGVSPRRGHDPGQFRRLPRAHVGGGIDLAAPLDHALEHLRSRRLGEPAQLAQRVLGRRQGAVGPYPDQHDPFQAQRPVLDLGDIGEFGGEPRDPSQCVPVLEVQLSSDSHRPPSVIRLPR
jgi:hypothetical protein